MNTPWQQPKPEQIEAFNAIVAEYEGALLRYAARILYDSSAAQDVVQDAFIKLFRSWRDELKPCPQISSWLYRVTHNGAVDCIRKRIRSERLHARHALEQPDFALPEPTRDQRVSEPAERAVQALRKLSLREQQLVILKIYEEKSYREISEITGLTVSNVGYILHYAMRKLAEELRKGQAS